jgi:GNAT superfamily N-acetyltransferase
MSASEHLSKKQFKFRTVDYPLGENDRPHFSDKYHAVLAVNAQSGEQIGNMTWAAKGSGKIAAIEVDPKFRRQGIATAMWNHANSVSPVTHGETRTPEGDAWAKSVGGKGLDKKACTTCGDEGHLASEHK